MKGFFLTDGTECLVHESVYIKLDKIRESPEEDSSTSAGRGWGRGALLLEVLTV